MLELIPIDFSDASAFVAKHHRHHDVPAGAKFCVAVSNGTEVVGVAIVGRPVSRMLDNGWILEVTRCCTDGSKNACSMLYGAAWRVSRAMGYKKLITYTLPSEGGASLRAAGWKIIGQTSGGQWNCKSRPRAIRSELLAGQKTIWEAQ